jgi:hypothetical protein
MIIDYRSLSSVLVDVTVKMAPTSGRPDYDNFAIVILTTPRRSR